MSRALGRRWDLEWRSDAHSLPEGPVELWIVIFGADGTVMGAGPVTEAPTWCWRDGALSIGYGPVHVLIQQRGHFARGLIVAVSLESRTWMPFQGMDLAFTDRNRELWPGHYMTVMDGVITLRTELQERLNDGPLLRNRQREAAEED
jgi:hypothetical protein